MSNCVSWPTERNTSSGNVVLVAHRFRVTISRDPLGLGALAPARYGLVDGVKRTFKSVQKKKEDIYKGSGEKKVQVTKQTKLFTF